MRKGNRNYKRATKGNLKGINKKQTRRRREKERNVEQIKKGWKFKAKR